MMLRLQNFEVEGSYNKKKGNENKPVIKRFDLDEDVGYEITLKELLMMSEPKDKKNIIFDTTRIEPWMASTSNPSTSILNNWKNE